MIFINQKYSLSKVKYTNPPMIYNSNALFLQAMHKLTLYQSVSGTAIRSTWKISELCRYK